MTTRRATLLALAAPLLALHLPTSAACSDDAAAQAPVQLTTVPGPFRSDAESLKTYRTPEWFRDAKFGIAEPLGRPVGLE